MNSLSRRSACIAATLALLTSVSVFAQAPWPSRPVRVVVPFPPGGPTDNLARPLLQILGERLGQPFVIDNRGGAKKRSFRMKNRCRAGLARTTLC